MDSDALPIQQVAITTPTSAVKVDDEDEQATFLNNCIKNETIDFEKSAEDKRNATVDGKKNSSLLAWRSIADSLVLIDDPLPGNDANSPSITNELRNEELARRKAVTNNYDMFADDDDFLDTNVNVDRHARDCFFLIFCVCL